jgi:hypothetical protein
MKRFCHAVIEVYGDEALRHPNAVDIGQHLDEGCAAVFPGCIGSIDCMHREWKNCCSGWRGMFQGKSGIQTVVLEAIANNCCRFWHFNFGSPGALNDLSILDRSPLFDNAVRGESPSVHFVVNRNAYQYAYWLGDGIHPCYACFVKTFAKPQTRMQKNVCLSTGDKQEGHRTSIWNAASKIPYPDIRLSSVGTSCNEDSYQDVSDSPQSCLRLRTSEWSRF